MTQQDDADRRGGPLWGNGKFDLVFLDAPCSGSGTWRRQPELRWRLTPERLAQAQALLDQGQSVPELSAQLEILASTLHKAIDHGRLKQFKKKRLVVAAAN